MRTKIAIAVLLLAIFALSSVTVIQIKPVRASPGSSATLALPDAELMLAEFTKEYGPGTLTGKVDVAGPGVQFDFTGLQPAVYTDVADDFPVNGLAGGAYKDYGYGFAGPYDFSGYTRYSACIENVGAVSVTVALKMNTGWTIDWSGGLWKGSDGFGASPARDTFWRGDWVTIAPGTCMIVSLDFSSATCYHAADDPVVAWQHPDTTTGVPVQRLDETSNIGFIVQGNNAGSIVIKDTQLYIDPPVVSKNPSDVGTTFNVNVMLSDFANLAGFDIKLTWNNSLITKSAVDYTTTLNALWGAGMWSEFFEQSGTGYYELVAVALATSASSTAAQALFTLTFHVNMNSTSPLQTPIHFEVASLSDNSVPIPKSICAIVTDGTYNMSPILTQAVTFYQVGVGADFSGTVLTVDGNAYGVGDLPKAFTWNTGSNHTFAYSSPLAVSASKRYVWTSTTGLSTTQTGNVTATGGTVTGNYKTQYYLTLTTNPSGIDTPTGAGWCDAGSFRIINTAQYATIIPGSSQYRFTNWTTSDMSEIADSSATLTTVKMDNAKTVTANYVSEPQPTISAPVIQIGRLDKQVVVNVTISNLNVEDRTIAVQFRLCYNDTLLQFVNATEGPFMQDPRWNLHGTFFVNISETDAVYGPSVVVRIRLLPNGTGNWIAFPFGSGTLATLTFTPLMQQTGLSKPPLTCSLHLVQNLIVDDNGNEVLSSTTDGLYKMLPTNIADLNHDYQVDMRDVGIAAKAFGTYPGWPRWNPIADITGPNGVPDGKVDMRDIGLVAHNFGWTALDP